MDDEAMVIICIHISSIDSDDDMIIIIIILINFKAVVLRVLSKENLANSSGVLPNLS